jgi:hypothetical protein
VKSWIKKPDYVLALKGNQGTLRQDVERFATEQEAQPLQGYQGQPP